MDSRTELILKSILSKSEYDDVPQSRIEKLLIDLKGVIESGGATPEQIKAAVDEYLDTHPVQPYDDTEIKNEISTQNEAINEELLKYGEILGGVAYKDFGIGYITLSSTVTSIPTNILPVQASNYVYAILPCSAGDVFHITSTGTPTARPYAFLDAARNIIDRSTKYVLNDEIVYTPDNAAFIVYNSLTDNEYSLVIGEPINETVQKIKQDVSDQFEAIGELDSRLKSGKIGDAELHLGFYLDENGDLCQKEVE